MGMGTRYGDQILGEVELHLCWGPMSQSRCGAHPLKFLGSLVWGWGERRV